MIGGLGEAIVDGEISNVGAATRVFAGIKMIGGYRLSGLEVENWIMREMGFPTNLMPSLRIVFDNIDRVFRGRHKKQKIS